MRLPRRHTAAALLVGLVLWMGASVPAHAADDFERYVASIRRLYDNLDNEEALEQIQRARRIARGVDQDVTLGLYEGLILADLNRWKEARSAFFTVLLLRPETTLPVKAAPKVEKEFEEQRAQAREELARLNPPATKPTPKSNDSGTEPQIEALEQPERESPEKLAPAESSRTLASGEKGSSHHPPISLDRPERGPTENLTPTEPHPALTFKVKGATRRTSFVPLALLGAGVMASVIGGNFGLSANGNLAQARIAPFREDALTHLNTAYGNARAANIMFGIAGLATASAVVTWVLLPSEMSSSTTPSEKTRQ